MHPELEEQGDEVIDQPFGVLSPKDSDQFICGGARWKAGQLLSSRKRPGILERSSLVDDSGSPCNIYKLYGRLRRLPSQTRMTGSVLLNKEHIALKTLAHFEAFDSIELTDITVVVPPVRALATIPYSADEFHPQ